MERKIKIIEGTTVDVSNTSVTVKGPNGELTRNFNDPRHTDIKIEKSDQEIVVSNATENRKKGAMLGTIIAHVRNMMHGVTEGYNYEMKIVYKHFPMTVEVKDNEVRVKNFIGEKDIRIAKIIGGCTVKVEKNTIKLNGANIEDVGQTAANIELACKLKGRDRRVFQDGIYISKKAKD